jgi:hypothetical protein
MPGERHHLQHHYDIEQYCEGCGLNGCTNTLSRGSILAMGSEIMFSKDSKHISRRTSYLLPGAVTVLIYLIYSKRRIILSCETEMSGS